MIEAEVEDGIGVGGDGVDCFFSDLHFVVGGKETLDEGFGEFGTIFSIERYLFGFSLESGKR